MPLVRQLGLRLLFSHQSFSQLVRGDYDLTTMIWQAQSRMIFGAQGDDADILAHELASLNYDPRKIKDELYSRKQLVTGHRLVELASWSQADAYARQWKQDYGHNWSRNQNVARRSDLHSSDVHGEGRDAGYSERSGHGGSETTSRTFLTFEEQKAEWAREIRKLTRGSAVVRMVDDPRIYTVDVQRSAPGHLAFDFETLRQYVPEAIEEMEALVERNFQSELFAAPETIDAEITRRLEAVTQPPIVLPSSTTEESGGRESDPFR